MSSVKKPTNRSTSPAVYASTTPFIAVRISDLAVSLLSPFRVPRFNFLYDTFMLGIRSASTESWRVGSTALVVVIVVAMFFGIR